VQDSLQIGYQTMIQVNPNTAYKPLDFETRRVQVNGRSLVTVLPKMFTDALGIERGDLVRFHLHVADKRKLVIEKIPIDTGMATPSTSSEDIQQLR
jgi:hypothetical protein